MEELVPLATQYLGYSMVRTRHTLIGRRLCHGNRLRRILLLLSKHSHLWLSNRHNLYRQQQSVNSTKVAE